MRKPLTAAAIVCVALFFSFGGVGLAAPHRDGLTARQVRAAIRSYTGGPGTHLRIFDCDRRAQTIRCRVIYTDRYDFGFGYRGSGGYHLAVVRFRTQVFVKRGDRRPVCTYLPAAFAWTRC